MRIQCSLHVGQRRRIRDRNDLWREQLHLVGDEIGLPAGCRDRDHCELVASRSNDVECLRTDRSGTPQDDDLPHVSGRGDQGRPESDRARRLAGRYGVLADR